MTQSMIELSEICDIVIGKTPSRDKPNLWGTGFPWVAISDMKKNEMYIQNTKEQITVEALSAGGCKKIPPNTLLLSFKLSIGKLAITTTEMFTNEAIAALIIKSPDKVDVQYLYYALQRANITKETDKAVKGLTLNKPKLQRIKVFLPSLEEQRRIISVLKKVGSIFEKRRQSIAKIDQFTQAIFFDMFGDPITNPMGWERLPMEKIGTVVTGNTPSRKIEEYFCGDLEWIKSDNINTPFHYLTKSKETLSPKGREVARVVPPGSILVTCIAGSKSCIGNVAMTDREVSFNQQINGIVPNYKLVTQLFLYAHIIIGKKLIQRASTNGMKGMVSKSAFEKIEMIVPPIDLQKKFSKAFDKIIKLQERNTLQNDHLVNLSNSLMNEYFGE
jgi:type I restriction enzyme S subunit